MFTFNQSCEKGKYNFPTILSTMVIGMQKWEKNFDDS